MEEWDSFDSISSAEGMWLTDTKGNKMIDAVASMWCNVWGHSKPELVKALHIQTEKLQHTSMFNLTHEPGEKLASSLIKLNPHMHKVFFSDNGSSAMEISLKIALQYWKNKGINNKTKIAALERSYHGDTFGAMSIGYVPEFFQNFKRQLLPVIYFPVPSKYRTRKKFTASDHQQYCLDVIEKKLSNDNTIAALVMESGAQVAGGVNIYPKGFQRDIYKACRKYDTLLVMDEIATGFGRLGSMTEYANQNSKPDIVSFGKMLTGGYLSMAATLVTKKIYDAFLGKFDEKRHLFHGHTYTGNALAAAVANENMRLYQKTSLIKRIRKTAKVFEDHYSEIIDIDVVGNIRHKGMLMGIELVQNKKTKKPITAKQSINKVIYEQGRRNGIYLRTLGSIVMLVPPLAITEDELTLLIKRAIKTINLAQKFLR